MFKPAPNAVGCLTNNAGIDDNVLYISTALCSYLQAQVDFNSGNHTYLVLNEVPYKEYVKVTSATVGSPSQITVEREKNGTQRRVHVANTSVKYEVTAEAIQDIAESVEAFVGVEAYWPLNSYKEDGVYKIELAELSITSENNSIDISGEWPDFDLAVNPRAQGCCGNGD